jgi:hypothetical protein
MSANEANLKDARDQLTLVLSFFPRVDGKLSTLLAVDTGMLAALSASVPSLLKVSAWMALGPVITTVLIVASYIYLYKGAFPYVKGGQGSVIYIAEIAKRTEAGFIEEYCKRTPEALRRDILAQIWRNSEILTAKYRCLKVSFVCTALSAIPWAVSLAALALVRANVQVVVPHP